MTRLYQWLHDRATAFRSETVDRHRRRTVRTEVTVRETIQEQTLLLTGMAVTGACPLCGHALGPAGLHGAAAQGFQSHSGCTSPQIEAEAIHAIEPPRAKKELP